MPTNVAPYVGAWIETLNEEGAIANLTSHPMWVRGLKQRQRLVGITQGRVAPYVGAWIETPQPPGQHPASQSHPMWVRGLKPEATHLRRRNGSRTLCGCVD